MAAFQALASPPPKWVIDWLDWEADLGDTGNFLTGIGTVALAIIAARTAVLGLRTYRSQAREKRGRWLSDLQHRFAVEPAFRTVRRELYNRDQSDLAKALRRRYSMLEGVRLPSLRPLSKEERERLAGFSPLTQEERELLICLDDYLEFFDLVKRLIDTKELGESDAFEMFSWYVLYGLEGEVIKAEVEWSYPAVDELRTLFKEHYRKLRGKDWTPSEVRPEAPDL